jgi:hypothetical protein
MKLVSHRQEGSTIPKVLLKLIYKDRLLLDELAHKLIQISSVAFLVLSLPICMCIVCCMKKLL